jgi:hypothetical protein
MVAFFSLRIRPRNTRFEEIPYVNQFRKKEIDIASYRKGKKRMNRLLKQFSSDPFVKRCYIVDREKLLYLERDKRNSTNLHLKKLDRKTIKTYHVPQLVNRAKKVYKYTTFSFLDPRIKGKEKSKRLTSFGLTAAQCLAEQQRYDSLLRRIMTNPMWCKAIWGNHTIS